MTDIPDFQLILSLRFAAIPSSSPPMTSIEGEFITHVVCCVLYQCSQYIFVTVSRRMAGSTAPAIISAQRTPRDCGLRPNAAYSAATPQPSASQPSGFIRIGSSRHNNGAPIK